MGIWSVGLGQWFGVSVRLHGWTLLLLAALIGAAAATGGSPGRVLALWLLLLFSILLRELARALAALSIGLDLSSLLVTPLGALPTFSNTRRLTPGAERVLAATGILTSLLAGATLFTLAISFSPGVDLLHQPWLSARSLLRSLVWCNLLLGALHLLPAVPLDAGRLLRSEIARTRGLEVASRASSGLSRLLSFALVFAGLALGSVTLGLVGLLVFLLGSLDRQSSLAGTSLSSVRIRDVMLENFFTLSSADTLEEALHRALHAPQDVFPVVRSGSLVGAVSRRGILDAMESSGNGYVQGVMTRDLLTAAPDDQLLSALERMSAHRGAQLLPVVEGDRVIGIVTPQNLSHSSRLLAQKRRLERSSGQRTRGTRD